METYEHKKKAPLLLLGLKDFPENLQTKSKIGILWKIYCFKKPCFFNEIITKKYGTVTEAKEIVAHLNNTTTRTLFACRVTETNMRT